MNEATNEAWSRQLRPKLVQSRLEDPTLMHD